MSDRIVAGAKVTELFGVDISGIDPETSVALTRAVLAQDSPPTKVTETGRRVVITWPAAGGAPVLVNVPMRVHDADTGEEFVDGTTLSINLGRPGNWTTQPIVADICRLTGPDAEPLGSRPAVPVDGEIPFAWFRYDVAEMRIADAGPTVAPSAIGSVEAEYDLDTGIRRDDDAPE